MRQSYAGISTPSGSYSEQEFEIACGACGSGDVELAADQPALPRFCDGGPTTADQLRLWAWRLEPFADRWAWLAERLEAQPASGG